MRLILLATAILVIILVPIVYFYSTSANQPIQPKAAIIDELGSSKLDSTIRYENQTFIETAREFLYKRFFAIDYYSDNATIEQYKQLATANYKLILWRAHSALNEDPKYVAISSTERYTSGKYDQYSEQLTLCNITGEADLHTMYFGITPRFIREVMNGRFEDTVIILMSCNGLRSGYYETARAFEEKGAKVLISWNEWVSTFDNDDGTSRLLEHLINENNTIDEAIRNTPMYSLASLLYYPTSSANYSIPDYRQNKDAKTQALVMPMLREEDHTRPARLFRIESGPADRSAASAVLKRSNKVGL